MKNSIEYQLILDHYTTRCATRSGVPLMNHIDEGLEILEWLGASNAAKGGYCLHPLVQDVKDLQENIERLGAIPEIEESLARALTYRLFANKYLCRPATDGWDVDQIRRVMLGTNMLWPTETRHMLIADKVQNQKDFLQYHYGTHARSEQLKKYFENWLEVLDYKSEVQRRDPNCVVFEDGVDLQ